MSATGASRIGVDTAIQRGSGMYIPLSGTTTGGDYGAEITNSLRLFAITREPAAHRMVFTVAHDIFDNWFKLEIKGKEDQDESKTFDTAIQKELLRLKAKREFNKMAIHERGFGWSIIVINYTGTEDHSKEVTEEEKKAGIEEICAYGPLNVSSVKEVKDPKDKRYGQPEFYFIKRKGVTTRLKVHWSRTIPFDTRLLEHDWKGISVLDVVWDDLVTLRNIRWGMGQTMYRYGSGFPDLTFTGAEKEQIQKWIDSGGFQDIFARSYFAHNEKQTIEFKGTAGKALDPMNYYLPVMEHLSMGSGIPLAILRGVQAGALTGSEVNQQEYYGFISDEQSEYEPGLRQLIDIIAGTLKKPETDVKTDQANEPPEFEFKWKSGIELSERGLAEIEHLKAQTLAIRGSWRTINELRKIEDPKDQGIPDGDRLPGAPNIPVGSQSFHVKTHPDGSRTVTEMPIRRERPSSS